VNGQALAPIEMVRGYARLQRKWRAGDVVGLSLPMPVQRVKAHPKVEADYGRVALQRGPLVYCLEAADNAHGVRNLVIPPESPLTARFRPDLLGGVTVVEGPALALYQAKWPEALYGSSSEVPAVTKARTHFTAIPYFANTNRRRGEMMVWVADTPGQARPASPRP
jgi:DUF1680 family protein